ncbi:Diaminopimelate decarboxylase [Armadillidium nasatum]|uniref:Diaminopimelate decarboxylase n=1 Tax=Armadillidium nasatum TaxID=96803 RepID=A0A5N5SVF5_9CRUS|nr:Diaminopimelate decarboxylase [Armadillidium nasatum]
MNSFTNYKDDILHMEDTNVLDIVNEVGTPVYCYSLNTIRRNYQLFSEYIPNGLICFAVKANSNIAVIKAVADMGGGADVVSEGEIRRALAAGIPSNKIIFSGVGKTEKEIIFALNKNIHQINVESLDELCLINKIAFKQGCVAPVAIRVNPNIDGKTNDKITTGLTINKFGVPEEMIGKIFEQNFANIDLLGVSVHIGSQICDKKVILNVFESVKKIVLKFKSFGCNVRRVDVGGGLGIAYLENEKVCSIEDYAQLLREKVCNLGYEVICEPGRSIVGNAGALITEVLYTKANGFIKHVIVDAGMNDFIRPALYDGKHRIIPIVQRTHQKEVVDIVGPICESGDIFARNYSIQTLHKGDLIAICDVGAYGASMSSTYNSRPLLPEVLVNKSKYAVIRKRGNYEDILNKDLVPEGIYDLEDT